MKSDRKSFCALHCAESDLECMHKHTWKTHSQKHSMLASLHRNPQPACLRRDSRDSQVRERLLWEQLTARRVYMSLILVQVSQNMKMLISILCEKTCYGLRDWDGISTSHFVLLLISINLCPERVLLTFLDKVH